MTIDQSIDFGLTAAAFMEGDADYTVEFEPFATKVELEGAGTVVASLGVDSGYVPYTAYCARESYLKENPKLIQGFTNAIQKGLDYVNSHTAEEIAAVIKPQFSETETSTITAIVERYLSQDTWKTDLIFQKESFTLLQEILMDAGELEEAVPSTRILSPPNTPEKRLKNSIEKARGLPAAVPPAFSEFPEKLLPFSHSFVLFPSFSAESLTDSRFLFMIALTCPAGCQCQNQFSRIHFFRPKPVIRQMLSQQRRTSAFKKYIPDRPKISLQIFQCHAAYLRRRTIYQLSHLYHSGLILPYLLHTGHQTRIPFVPFQKIQFSLHLFSIHLVPAPFFCCYKCYL